MSRITPRRRDALLAALALPGLLALPARAQGRFPEQPVKLVVGFPPGAAATCMAA